MAIDKATLEKLLDGVDPGKPQSIFTDAGLFGQLKLAYAIPAHCSTIFP